MAIIQKKPAPSVSAPGKGPALDQMPPGPPANPIPGSPYGTLPFNAPRPVPQTPPATPPSRPLGSTFGNPGANIQNILSGVTPSRAGVATGASQALAPQPPPTGMAPMGGGMQLPPTGRPSLSRLAHAGQNRGFTPPEVSPFAPPANPTPMGPLFSGELPSRPDFPHLPMLAPSGQPMVNGPGYSAPPPQGVQFGPPVPPHYDPQAPIRALQDAGVVGSRVGQEGKGPGPMPPLAAALLNGQKPITGPTGQSMATDTAQSTPGGLLSDSQAAQNYRNSPADSRYMPNTTAGGRFGQPSPIRDPRSADTQKQITDAQNVARFGNGREAELARLNNQGFKAPPDKQHDFGLTNSGKFKEGGQRIEPYSETDKQKMADATAKLNSPERKAYLDKRASQVADRKEKAAGRIQEKAIARSDTRMFNQGRLDNNTRFAFMNPREATARDVGLANADAVKGNNAARIALDEKRINATREVGMDRNDAIRQQGRDRLSADAMANNRPDPFAPKQEAGPVREPTPQDIRLMPKADGYTILKEKYGEAEANRRANEIYGTQDWNYEKYPNGPTLGAELFGSDNRVPPSPPAPQPAAPAPGAPSRARMGGGMQLPPTGKKPQKPNPYEQNIAGRWGGYMN